MHKGGNFVYRNPCILCIFMLTCYMLANIIGVFSKMYSDKDISYPKKIKECKKAKCKDGKGSCKDKVDWEYHSAKTVTWIAMIMISIVIIASISAFSAEKGKILTVINAPSQPTNPA